MFRVLRVRVCVCARVCGLVVPAPCLRLPPPCLVWVWRSRVGVSCVACCVWVVWVWWWVWVGVVGFVCRTCVCVTRVSLCGFGVSG